MTAYRFGDKYLIPQFDRPTPWEKWLLVPFGLLPLAAIGGVTLVRAMRARARRESPPVAAVPPTFSLRSMSFDGTPEDSQLACLLGGQANDVNMGTGCRAVTIVDEGGVLAVRPRLFPMNSSRLG